MMSGLAESSSFVVGTDKGKDAAKRFKDNADLPDKIVLNISEQIMARINKHCRLGCAHCRELVASLAAD